MCSTCIYYIHLSFSVKLSSVTDIHIALSLPFKFKSVTTILKPTNYKTKQPSNLISTLNFYLTHLNLNSNFISSHSQSPSFFHDALTATKVCIASPPSFNRHHHLPRWPPRFWNPLISFFPLDNPCPNLNLGASQNTTNVCEKISTVQGSAFQKQAQSSYSRYTLLPSYFNADLSPWNLDIVFL